MYRVAFSITFVMIQGVGLLDDKCAKKKASSEAGSLNVQVLVEIEN